MNYDVFLSHNSKDKPTVEAIAHKLQEAYGLKCWLDKWNLVPSEPWQEALEEALDDCQTVAVFVGPNIISPWENEEVRSALETRAQDKSRRVIPVLLPGAPDKDKLDLPRFLKRLTWVDFRVGLDDEDALHLLYCGITGKAPGTPIQDKFTNINKQSTTSRHITAAVSAQPIIKRETLYSNILPVFFPEQLYVAEMRYRERNAIYRAFYENGITPMHEFVLVGNKIYSFRNLATDIWTTLCKSKLPPPKAVALAEYAWKARAYFGF